MATAAAAPNYEMVQLKQITHDYGTNRVLHNIDLSIAKGEFFTLLGPSGCGKTTLLRIIAGLHRSSEGRLTIDGEDATRIPPHRRNIGVVFQNLALFPHMTVGQNISFSLKMRGMRRSDRPAHVSRALDAVRLPGVEARYPNELSGGQRQRVAIARSLVFEPPLLLLDEPLAALDRRLREEMQVELIRLHQELGITIINVTHDQREALRVSDRLAVMQAGKILQVGTPEKIYSAPVNREVAAFLGEPTLIEGVVEGPSGAPWWSCDGFKVPISKGSKPGAAYLTLRSESLLLKPNQENCRPAGMPVTVELATFEGDGFYYQVRGPVGPIVSLFDSGAREGLRAGEQGWLSWDPEAAPVVPVEVGI